jgi:DNA-binding MarR family transcriptional regulator
VIDRLEQKHLVRREVSADDRRARLLHLTPEGRQLLAAVRPVVEALQADILGSLSDRERADFLALARKALRLAVGPDAALGSEPAARRRTAAARR